MKQYIRIPGLEAVEMEQEWMILNPEQYTVTKLNEVGGLCWSLLDQAQTVESLTASICEQYDISEAFARKDVASFLSQMLEVGLVKHAS